MSLSVAKFQVARPGVRGFFGPGLEYRLAHRPILISPTARSFIVSVLQIHTSSFVQFGCPMGTNEGISLYTCIDNVRLASRMPQQKREISRIQ
jgi:hypothetical protein